MGAEGRIHPIWFSLEETFSKYHCYILEFGPRTISVSRSLINYDPIATILQYRMSYLKGIKFKKLYSFI